MSKSFGNDTTETRLRSRLFMDGGAHFLMRLLAVGALVLPLVMGTGLLYKSIPLISEASIWSLIGGKVWNPMKGVFGFLPFMVSSLYVTLIALVIAVPVSLMTALYLSENAPAPIRKTIFPILDILAGLPSVVYGLWGTIVVVPWVSEVIGPHFVDYTSGYTLLSGGVVLSVMIMPLLISLFVEIFSSVPHAYKEASAALGATRWQTTHRVVLRKSQPGVIAAVALSVSKAFGETMAVLMVCGNMIGFPTSLFDGAYPLPALIANNYGEMLSLPMFDSALMFAALIMFVVIILFNIVSRLVLNRVERK